MQNGFWYKKFFEIKKFSNISFFQSNQVFLV
jgi:hypothetical protein